MTEAEIHSDRLAQALAHLFEELDAERFNRALWQLPPPPTPLQPEQFAHELMRRYGGMPKGGL